MEIVESIAHFNKLMSHQNTGTIYVHVKIVNFYNGSISTKFRNGGRLFIETEKVVLPIIPDSCYILQLKIKQLS